MAGELIPITISAVIAVVFCVFFWFRYRTRSDMQKTFRTAIDKGHELSPEIIDRIGQPKPPKHKDLRIALVWIAIAVGTGLFGAFVPDPSDTAMQALLAIAAFPLCLGIAYAVMYVFTSNER